MKTHSTPIIATGIVWLLYEISFAGMVEGQVLSGVRPYNCVRNFYVNGASGNDVSTSGSQSYPWKTIQYANNSGGLQAGDCVNVAPGTYLQSPLYLTNRASTNLDSSYATYIGAPNSAATLTVSPGTFGVERINIILSSLTASI